MNKISKDKLLENLHEAKHRKNLIQISKWLACHPKTFFYKGPSVEKHEEKELYWRGEIKRLERRLASQEQDEG